MGRNLLHIGLSSLGIGLLINSISFLVENKRCLIAMFVKALSKGETE